MKKNEVFDPKWIVIHCSATKEGDSLPPSVLEQEHRRRGFKGCGYHFYITRNGRVFSMRPTTEAGAHVKGYNHCSIGVCYEGGLDAEGNPADTRTLRQRRAIVALIDMLRKEFRIERITGHRNLSPDLDGDGVVEPNEWVKMCPCFDAEREYLNN